MLSMDAVEAANPGHPGMPMGMADIAEVLWNDYLQVQPGERPLARPRPVRASNGHGSMLLYSVAYLTGYDIELDELKKFRQLGSRVPDIPSASSRSASRRRRGRSARASRTPSAWRSPRSTSRPSSIAPAFRLVDHYTYVFLGDGCLMEGISHEACSFAGTQKLGKLIAFYDDNGISIDGETRGWFTDDTPKRFEAYGWHVVPNVDGHDPEAVRARHRRGARGNTSGRR